MEALRNPIAAVTHPNPYAYYARLTTEKPLYYDDELGSWVASSAQAVTAVLESDICRVRPGTEPVPKALLNSPAADIFRHLVRMNDGDYHRSLKGAVSATLQPLDLSNVRQLSQQWAQVLSQNLVPHHLSAFAFHLPVYVLGSLLGIPRDALPQTTLWLDNFVRCLAPGSNTEQIEKGKEAASSLLELMQALLKRDADGLLNVLAKKVNYLEQNNEVSILANGIGFLSQAYEASAGLIGNTLLMLAKHPELQDTFMTEPHQFIQEVLRYDSPVQNTRRFVAEDGLVAGQTMKAGDVILVVLAAANYDSSVNPNPHRFDTFRKDRHCFTFGLGKHSCPGERLACTIAQAALEQLLSLGLDFNTLSKTVSYRPSANTRIPLFG